MSDNNYFKSIDEWSKDKAFALQHQEREFAATQPGGLSDVPEGVSRREFVKMMAGGMALLGLTGCRRPESHIVPMTEQPENRVVGNPLFFASSVSRSGEAIPLMVETHGGRPTKLEGNARYTPFAGATDAATQAYILDLYDPDRATKHYKDGAVIDRATAVAQLRSAAASWGQGQGLAVVAHPTTSPTLLAAQQAFRQRYPLARWITYTPFDTTRAQAALQSAFGRPLRVQYHFDKADRILAIDSDFLASEVGAIAYARAFAARRTPHNRAQADAMNRLYVVEPTLTLTGGQADHRLRLADSQLTAFAAALLAQLQRLAGDAVPPALAQAQLPAAAQAWLTPLAADLWAHRGHGALVTVGSHQSSVIQQLVFAINDLLGAQGSTLSYLQLPANTPLAMDESLQGAQEIIVFDANPAYDAPQSLGWAAAAPKARRVIRWGLRTDETSLTLPANNLQILAAHGLESWGLGAAYDGTILAQQPMIEPLFGGVEPLEWWASLCGLEVTPRQWTMQVWAQLTGLSGEKAFNDFLNIGLQEKSSYPVARLGAWPQWGSLLAELSLQLKRSAQPGLQLLVRPSSTVGTGESANNAWLQECPDPITKLTWGNALYVSPATAQRLGYHPAHNSWLPIAAQPLSTLDRGRKTSPIALLQVGQTSLRVPLAIQPGMADDTAYITLGYGHTKYGRNADGVGVNAYPFIAAHGLTSMGDIHLKLTGDSVLLASTQNHWSIEGRDHYREGDREDFLKNERFAAKMGVEAHAPANLGAAAAWPMEKRVKETPRGNSAYEHPDYTAPQQWGMTIDLGACTGCNACVLACQSENNIPSVGREQILRGREMHWIRIDRYYASGSVAANSKEIPHDVDMGMQPMTCQHCERAPCEQVCPVNATVHDEQGLNVMAYNRCVGTRYCANNCPYKVRRFNFFDYAKRNRDNFYWGMFGPEGMPDILKLQKNPDVTIRSRGVMEKCTFCVQRIEQAKIRQRIVAKDSGHTHVADGIIRTACQQACPSGAIVFGDVADPTSAVSRLKGSPRDYLALNHLNTRPRLSYLARLRNQNRQMPDFRPIVRFRLEQGAGKDHGPAHEAHAEAKET